MNTTGYEVKKMVNNGNPLFTIQLVSDFSLLQHRQDAFDDAFFGTCCLQFNAVGVGLVGFDFAIDIAVPGEVRVFGREYQTSPAVIDLDGEFGDILDARQTEHVIDTIKIRGSDGIRQVDVERTDIEDGYLTGVLATVFNSGNGVGSSFRDGDVLCGLARTPNV